VLDLHVPDQKKAGDIQERVSNICSRQIIPALSKLCDELSHGHRSLIVDFQRIHNQAPARVRQFIAQF